MVATAQKSFALGELAPSLYARSDLARYYTGLRTCRNMMTMRQGGVQNRPGTTYITEVKDSSRTVRLIPFIFNSDQTYVLEFGNLYMRVLKDGEVVESSPGVPFELVTPYVEADLPTLNYAQSADVVTIVHPNYAPRELARLSDTSWTLTSITFGPSISPPSYSATGTTGGYAQESWILTSVNLQGEESLRSVVQNSNTRASHGTPITFSWSAVTDAVEYRVYKKISSVDGFGVYVAPGTNGVYGLVANPTTPGFIDVGDTSPDLDNQAPLSDTGRNPFDSSGNYPSAVIYSQQRLIFANTDNEPETIWASRIGSYKNFEIIDPISDSDSLEFTLVGRQVNEILHMLEIRQLLALTTGSEWAINGNDAGGLTPTTINAKQQSYNGCSFLPPLYVNGNALYIQARGSVVRSLDFDQVEQLTGQDLTIFSSHLFDNYTLENWDFQQIPHSVIWIARSDGKLLALTYIPDQQMIAWHRHDFHGGTVENVCVVPEDNEDVLYLVIKRTIDGSTVRYIEKLNTRQITDIEDAIFMDSALTYDGRNTGSTTMTLSGGTNWTRFETLTLTASASFFVSGDVGNQIFLYDDDPESASYGDVIRFTIDSFSSGFVVAGRAHKTVPVGMRSTSTLEWSKAVDQVSGLDHLEGEEVSVIGDGFVVASPNNPDYSVITVSGGSITLPQPRAVIHVGLPFISDVETLDIDTPEGETLSNKKKLITEVSMFVEKSRGIWIGPKPPTDDDQDPLENLQEAKLRNNESYDEPTELKTEVVTVPIKGEWNSNGRVFIRQVDPLPLSILSIVPSGYVPKEG